MKQVNEVVSWGIAAVVAVLGHIGLMITAAPLAGMAYMVKIEIELYHNLIETLEEL